ncbi:hypothetical protein AAZV13_10G089100 [Glycine max]
MKGRKERKTLQIWFVKGIACCCSNQSSTSTGLTVPMGAPTVIWLVTIVFDGGASRSWWFGSWVVGGVSGWRAGGGVVVLGGLSDVGLIQASGVVVFGGAMVMDVGGRKAATRERERV